MTMTGYRIQPGTRALTAVTGIFEDLDVPEAVKGNLRTAIRNGYGEPLATTLRTIGAMRDLSHAGLYDDLMFALEPDIVLRENDQASAMFDLGPNGVRLIRDTNAAIPSVTLAGRRVLDPTLGSTGASGSRLVAAVPASTNPAQSFLPVPELIGRPGWTVMALVNYSNIGAAERYFLSVSIPTVTMIALGAQSGLLQAIVRRNPDDAATKVTAPTFPQNEWHSFEVTFDAPSGTVNLSDGATQIGTSSAIGAGGDITWNGTINASGMSLGNTGTGTTNCGCAFASIWAWKRVLTDAERTTARTIMASINPQVPA